jgi:hypothetical protein
MPKREAVSFFVLVELLDKLGFSGERGELEESFKL